MNSRQSFFQPSVNIRFDFGSPALYERYLPTPSHADALKGLLKGFLGEGSRAHIIVGPYGSGKSLLGSILASTVSNNVRDDQFSQLLEKFQTVDDKIHDQLLEVKKQSIKYIPVFLNGDEGNFRRGLLSALYEALQHQNLDFTQPIVATDILNIVEIWRTSYESTYEEFQQKLKEYSWTIETWSKDVEKLSEKAIVWFKSIYPSLTAGSQLSINFDKDIITQLKFILGELRLRNLGLFIVYDEFGRFLQTIPSTGIHEVMQEMQDLAEFANSALGINLSILLITHRNLGQYALRYQEELQKEFQRIEKRYSTYYTKADPSTFIRLSSLATKHYRQDTLIANEFVKQLRYFDLFPDLNVFELDSLIIKESYPLHPISLFVLPHLANLVAQNERTLFTFLESDERGGLKAVYEEHRDWYRIDNVFDYFEPSFGQFEMDSSIGQAYSLYQRLYMRLTESTTRLDQLKIIKLLTTWSIAGLYIQQVPTEDFISFAFSWEPGWTRNILEELHARKIIRYNNTLEHWELFEGSSVDLESEIESRLQQHSVSKRQKMDVLRSILSKKYVLPKQYNDDRSMTRYALIYPVYQSELQKDEWIQTFSFYHQADAIIYYVINDTDQKKQSAKRSLKDISENEETSIFVIANEHMPIDGYLEQLEMLHLMRDDKYFISQDKYLQGELESTIEKLVFKIDQALAPITKFQNSTWIYNGKSYLIKSNMALSKMLSNVMDQVYSHTPEIINESFNRKTITKVQKNAAIQVLNKILLHHKTNSIDIQGFGPDYLIFTTVIKNNNICFDQPDITANENLRMLRNDLLDVVKRGNGNFVDLVNIFSERPYGIRKPIIPILLTSLLYKEWNYLMFYHHGMFNSSVDGDLLYYMVENPDQYTFKYLTVDEKYVNFTQKVKETFIDFVRDEDQYLHPAVFVNQVLLRWLRSLPRIVQNTNQTSIIANQVKVYIREGEVQPETSLELLYNLCVNEGGKEQQILKQVKAVCEEYNDAHKKRIGDSILQSAAVRSFKELKTWAQNQAAIVKASNPYVKSIISAEDSSWVDYLCERVIGVKRENWSDTTDQLFMNQVRLNIEKIGSEIRADSYIEIKIGESPIAIQNVELSEHSKAMLNATKANMAQMARRVPREELQIMLLELLKEFTKEQHLA